MPIAEKPKRKGRPPTPMEAAIYAAWGIDPTTGVTRDFARMIAGIAKQLQDAGAMPDDVAAKKAAYERQHPDWECTPPAVSKHWPTLRVAPKREPRQEITFDYEHNPFARHIRDSLAAGLDPYTGAPLATDDL